MVDVEYCRILMLNIADCVGVTFCNTRTQMQKINIVFCFWCLLLLLSASTKEQFLKAEECAETVRKTEQIKENKSPGNEVYQ